MFSIFQNYKFPFFNNLPLTASSCTVECFAIFEALQLIFTLTSGKFLIVLDSLSCLQALVANVFRSHPSHLLFKIKKILFTLAQSGYDIQFLWMPGHSGIHGNEFVDSPARFTLSLRYLSSNLFSWTDFCPMLKFIYINYGLPIGQIYRQISLPGLELLLRLSLPNLGSITSTSIGK